MNMTDDILIFADTTEEHHAILYKVLAKLEQNGMTAQLRKSEFYKTQLTFFGLNISGDGIAPTINRCEALQKLQLQRTSQLLVYGAVECTVHKRPNKVFNN